MKILSLIVLIVMIASLPSVSNAISVTAYVRLPFDCGSVYEEAEQNLKMKCQEISKKLESFTVDQCQPDGDDGGYVNYFAVTATGECL